MPCKCTCGRDIDCGDIICPICEDQQQTVNPGLPPGTKPEDFEP